MRRRSLVTVTGAILTVIFACVTICCAAQAATKYIQDQENKNVLIASISESSDPLRSCLQPASSFTSAGQPLNIDAVGISGIVPSAGAISISVNPSCTAIAPSPREDITEKGKSAGK
jgi:hypothetical protein